MVRRNLELTEECGAEVGTVDVVMLRAARQDFSARRKSSGVHRLNFDLVTTIDRSGSYRIL